MTVIEASSVRLSTMADGTLRIVCDIEPTNARAAFELFGAPGTPMALAALRIGHAAASDEPEELKGGPLAKSAGMLCAQTDFQAYARVKGYPQSNDGAVDLIRTFCGGIESRRELDHNEAAAASFARLMEKYRKWLNERREIP